MEELGGPLVPVKVVPVTTKNSKRHMVIKGASTKQNTLKDGAWDGEQVSYI